MAILNMNYSVSGSGGANIGEPLNLTVTTSGLDATITWEDNEIGTIPPTSFAKSELVRKVGSAPTSPSDGTLVVTETVKDTYKVSGYVDSGLTDGTTYYYRVFSYSDLGGISYCDAVSVTPSGGWQPGVNTIAYYPLTATSQGNDMKGSGTAYNLSASGNVSYTTVGGISVMQGGTGYLTGAIATLPVGATIRTISIWAELTSIISNTDLVLWQYGNRNMHKNQMMAYHTYDGRCCIDLSNHYDDLTNLSFPDATIGQWYNVIYVYDGTTQNIYINNSLYATQSIALETVSTDFNIGGCSLSATDNFTGYLSECIIEDKVWTAQERADYFDATKSDYGIS